MSPIGERTGRQLDVGRTVSAAVDGLLATVRANGSWEGRLPSSAVSTAAAVIALHAADAGTQHTAVVDAGVDWLLAEQNADGGWGDLPGGRSTLNATAMAASALQLVRGGRPGAAGGEAATAVAAATEAIERLGGTEALEDPQRASLNTVVRVLLAEAGLYDGDRVPRIPLGVAFLPRRVHQKVSFVLPGLLSWGVMQARERHAMPPRRALHRLAELRVLRYLRGIRQFEGPDGGAEESALMVALIVFGLVRAGLAGGASGAAGGVAGDIAGKYLDYLVGAARPDGSWPIDRDLELSGTCYVLQGLCEAGLADEPRLRRSRDWVLGCQRRVPLAATGCPPGGWGWALPSSWPDTDDTALALLALSALGLDVEDEQVRAGADWLRAMRNRDGSWSCFVRDGRSMFDGPCAVLTAHATVALHQVGGRDDRLDRAVRWLAAAQQQGGPVPCVWFRGSTAGTARVLDALSRIGMPDAAVAPRCVRWLLDQQGDDGGWGDGQGSAASVEETAWATLALLGVGLAGHQAVTAGVRWLASRQNDDGLWTPSPVGYYYDDLTYSCDAMANGYALAAVSRYHAQRRHHGCYDAS